MSPKAKPSRRRQITVLGLSLAAVAVLLGWLESGTSVVIYNDTPEPIAGLTVRMASTVWEVDLLAAGESRRWQPPAGASGDLSITAANWGEGTPCFVPFASPRAGNLIVHLRSFGTITSSTDTTWWRKLQAW